MRNALFNRGISSAWVRISPSTACKPRHLELRRAVHLANFATLALLFTRRPLHLAIFRTLMMGVDQQMAEKTAEIEESARTRGGPDRVAVARWIWRLPSGPRLTKRCRRRASRSARLRPSD
jgi:hypothetical protein